MKESAALLGVLILLAGCNSAPPSMNPLAPYGARRVPPPATGSFARPDSYYQPSNRTGFSATGEAPTSPATPAPATNGLTAAPSANPAAGLTSAPRAATGSVQLVSLDGSPVPSANGAAIAAPSSNAEMPVRIVAAPRASTMAAPKLQGMVAHDATQLAEPAPFTPSGQMKDLSQYPVAASPPQPALTQPASSTAGASSATTGATSAGWQSR